MARLSRRQYRVRICSSSMGALLSRWGRGLLSIYSTFGAASYSRERKKGFFHDSLRMVAWRSLREIIARACGRGGFTPHCPLKASWAAAALYPAAPARKRKAGGVRMNQRRLGRTNPTASEIGLGTWRRGAKWGRPSASATAATASGPSGSSRPTPGTRCWRNGRKGRRQYTTAISRPRSIPTGKSKDRTAALGVIAHRGGCLCGD